jgi:carbonic anhydrase/acetyltransferase-like protein (isoleucine patch superfamily)
MTNNDPVVPAGSGHPHLTGEQQADLSQRLDTISDNQQITSPLRIWDEVRAWAGEQDSSDVADWLDTIEPAPTSPDIETDWRNPPNPLVPRQVEIDEAVTAGIDRDEYFQARLGTGAAGHNSEAFDRDAAYLSGLPVAEASSGFGEPDWGFDETVRPVPESAATHAEVMDAHRLGFDLTEYAFERSKVDALRDIDEVGYAENGYVHRGHEARSHDEVLAFSDITGGISVEEPAANAVAARSGRQLKEHLNAIGARDLSFGQAANFGVELVYHPDSRENQVFHTADGDVVYRSYGGEWDVVGGARRGDQVKSGQMHRVHSPSISSYAKIAGSARVDPSATVEPGARIGPHAVVGRHAHVGADSTVASFARIEAGAFVGAFSSIKDGSRVGPGAVIGTGSRVGPTTNIGAGARLEQRTEIAAFANVAANSRVGGHSASQRPGSRLRPGQITSFVERLAALDRD